MIHQPKLRGHTANQAVVALCILASFTLPMPGQQSPGTPVATQAATLPRHQTQAASDAYLEGARALEHNNAAAAEQAFARAAALDPGNSDYTRAVALAHEHRINDLVHRAADTRLHGHPAEADTLLAEAHSLDPGNSLLAQQTADTQRVPLLDIQPQAKRAPQFADAIALQPDSGKRSFHFRGDVRQTVTQVEQAFGIKVIFDDSTGDQQLRFDLDDVAYPQAVPLLFSMAHVFGVPLDSKTLLIARESTENHARLDHLVEETLYIPGQSASQLQDIANIIRNLFDVKLLTVQQGASSMTLRTTPEAQKAINIILADLLDGGADVMLQLQIYSVDISHSRDIGFQPPQFGAYNVSAAAQSLVSANQTLVNQAISQGLISSTDSLVAQAFKLIASGLVSSTLLSSTIGIIGGTINPTTGAVSNQFTTTGITTSSTPTFNLSLNASEAHALQDTKTRISDRETATFRTGSRYPITTSTYSTPTISSLAGVSVNGTSASSLLAQYLGTTSTTTIPQISYEDLGLTLKATPMVQKSGRVFLHLDLKLEALGGTSLNNIPVLDSRTMTSDVTVDEGESTLLVSTLSKSESSAVTGLPGLSQLPGFQVPTEQNATRDSSELVILITPHVIRHRAVSLAGPRIPFNIPASSRTD